MYTACRETPTSHPNGFRIPDHSQFWKAGRARRRYRWVVVAAVPKLAVGLSAGMADDRSPTVSAKGRPLCEKTQKVRQFSTLLHILVGILQRATPSVTYNTGKNDVSHYYLDSEVVENRPLKAHPDITVILRYLKCSPPILFRTIGSPHIRCKLIHRLKGWSEQRQEARTVVFVY